MSFQALATLVALCFWFHIPSPGYSIGCLAVVAALMSLHEHMHPLHKAVWIVIMGVLLVLEFKSIDKDRRENQEQQARILARETQGFQSIMDQEQSSLGTILKQQGDSFRATVKMLVEAQRQDRSQFSTLLATQQALFDHEQKLVESLSGRLVPGSDPMPTTTCRSIGKDDVIVLLGENNAVVINMFPHVIMKVLGHDVMSVARDPTGSLIINMAIRGADDKIIARLNKGGFVVNRNSELQIERPDGSTLVVEDEYGTTVLYARFMNSRAISLRGVMHTQGRTIPVDLPFMTNSCVVHTTMADISIN